MTSERLSVRLFGPPAFTWRDQSFSVPTRKATALLCYVALRGTTSRTDLAELLWEAGQHRNLRLELYRSRQLPGAASWLLTDSLINVNAQTDVTAFEVALEKQDYSRALSFYDGTDDKLLLKDLEPKTAPAFEDWLELERQRVTALFGDALRGYSEQLERAGRLGEALEKVQRLLIFDPLDESAHRTVMRLEWRLGNVGAAQEQFERCRRILAEELGLSPTPETEVLAAAIEHALSNDSRAGSKAVLRRIPPELLRPPALVGRDAEWATLERAWERKQAVYISGPPGVGKTRLLLDFAQAKTAGNFSLVQGLVGDKSVPLSTLARAWHSYFSIHPTAPEQLKPWVQREVARFLPETFDFATSAIQTEQEQLRFMSAVYALFFEKCMRVDANLADDLQFFDGTSFYLSAYATGRLVREGLPGKAVHTLMAFRSNEMPQPFFEAIATQVAADRAVHLKLEPLSIQATQTLLGSLKLPDDLTSGAELRRATGGNPLLMVEVLRDQFEKGQAFGVRDRLPERINLQISNRLSRLSQTSLYLVQTLAALQDFTTPELLEAVLGIDVLELTESLSELERAQIITGLAFSHDLIYEAVLQNTPSAVTQLIHHKIAVSLEASSGQPARIAHHWSISAQPERALPWYLRAAEIAITQGSSAKAREWLEDVLAHAAPETTLYQRAEELLQATQLKS